VPRQYSTGGRSILGRISKRGSKYLRTLFIQAANVILMRPHNWERFSFGTWLSNAAPRLHRNKLATALANKLARIAWSILRNEKTFDAPPSRGDGYLKPSLIRVRDRENAWNESMNASRVWWH